MKGGIAMPAAAFTVDQSLVDNYIARVDRFANNVETFAKTLAEMKNTIMSNISKKEEPVRQETAAIPNDTVQSVVTADEIDLDALLKGIDLSGAEMNM